MKSGNDGAKNSVGMWAAGVLVICVVGLLSFGLLFALILLA